MRRRRDGWWSWPGAVAFVIAFFVAGGWCAGIVLAATPPSIRAVGTQSGLDVLSTVGGVLAGAVATYVGASITERRHRDHRNGVPSDETGPDGTTTPDDRG